MSPLIFYSVWIFVLGLCVGSFLNVCISRLPRHESILYPPSHCPECGHSIRAWENIPVLSYVFLRGRCSGCGQPISLQYPLVELATGILFTILWQRLWLTGASVWATLPALILAAILLATALTDIKHGMIPNMLTLPGIGLAVLLTLVLPSVETPLLWGPSQPAAWLSSLADILPIQDHAPPLLAALGGALLGGGVLLVFREIGRLAWGKARITCEQSHQLRISALGLVIDEDDPRPLHALLPRRSDTLTVELEAPPSHPSLADNAKAGDRIRVTRTGVQLNHTTIAFNELGELYLSSRRWWQPREVLGLGDVKLAAVLGSFLGITGGFFALTMGALLGTVWGILALACTRGQSGGTVAFAPFLAGGGMIWLLAGPEILYWYSRLFG
ncbi:MAG: prepilin peptidase [Verrucomicrobiota bacterium]